MFKGLNGFGRLMNIFMCAAMCVVLCIIIPFVVEANLGFRARSIRRHSCRASC